MLSKAQRGIFQSAMLPTLICLVLFEVFSSIILEVSCAKGKLTFLFLLVVVEVKVVILAVVFLERGRSHLISFECSIANSNNLFLGICFLPLRKTT